MKLKIPLLLVLVCAANSLFAQVYYPDWSYSMIVSSPRIYDQYFENGAYSLKGNSSGTDKVNYDELYRNKFLVGIYQNVANPYTFTANLNDAYDRWAMSYEIHDFQTPKTSGAFMFTYMKPIVPWLHYGVSLGQVNYRGTAEAYFVGSSNDYSEQTRLQFSYEQKSSAVINDYILRLSSPYLLKRFAAFYEFGVSLKYIYDSHVHETVRVTEFPSSLIVSQQEYKHRFSAKDRTLNLDWIPMTIGGSVLISKGIAIEAFVSIRKGRSKNKYNPAEHMMTGLGVRFNPNAFKID